MHPKIQLSTPEPRLYPSSDDDDLLIEVYSVSLNFFDDARSSSYLISSPTVFIAI
jgi:hypothetical protein